MRSTKLKIVERKGTLQAQIILLYICHALCLMHGLFFIILVSRASFLQGPPTRHYSCVGRAPNADALHSRKPHTYKQNMAVQWK